MRNCQDVEITLRELEDLEARKSAQSPQAPPSQGMHQGTQRMSAPSQQQQVWYPPSAGAQGQTTDKPPPFAKSFAHGTLQAPSAAGYPPALTANVRPEAYMDQPSLPTGAVSDRTDGMRDKTRRNFAGRDAPTVRPTSLAMPRDSTGPPAPPQQAQFSSMSAASAAAASEQRYARHSLDNVGGLPLPPDQRYAP